MNHPVAEHRASKFESVHATPFIVFVTKVSPILTASPNPVPAGDAKGQTTISWNALGESAGKVYVSINGGKESLFAVGRERLKLLDKIIVTRAKQ